MFNVEKSDMAGLPLSALASLCTIGSYYYLQPLGDTLALSMGLEYTPLVTVGNMFLIVILNPIYAAAVRALPTDSIVPYMFRIVSVMLLVFAGLFASFEGLKLLSFLFAVYVGTSAPRGSLTPAHTQLRLTRAICTHVSAATPRQSPSSRLPHSTRVSPLFTPSLKPNASTGSSPPALRRASSAPPSRPHSSLVSSVISSSSYPRAYTRRLSS